MTTNKTLKISCTYGGSNFLNELTVDGEILEITNKGETLLKIALSEVKSSLYSSNYVQLITGTDKYTIRGIKPLDYKLPFAYKSFSDRKSLNLLVEYLKSKNIPSKFQLVIIDKRVVIVVALFLAIFLAIIVIILLASEGL